MAEGRKRNYRHTYYYVQERDVAAISIRFDKKSAFKTAEVDSIFKAIPSHTPIFTNVSTKEDIELISMSKSNGMKVSCNVEIGRGRPQKAEAKSILSPWLKEAPPFASKAPMSPISTTFELPLTTGRRHSLKGETVVAPRAAVKETVESAASTTEVTRQQKAITVPELSNAHILDASSPFYRHHILSSNQFTRDQLHILFGVAQETGIMAKRHGSINLHQGRVLCNFFYEPSTRTSSSFEAAMIRLGGQVISTNVEIRLLKAT